MLLNLYIKRDRIINSSIKTPLWKNLPREPVEILAQKLEKLVSANIPEKGLVVNVLSSNPEQSKDKDLANYSVTQEVDQLEIDYLGILNDRHRRPFRERTGKESSIYSRGNIIREHRHIFVVSLYDCKVLSNLLGVEVTPELLGANLVIERKDKKDFSISALPENTNLLIAQENSVEFMRPPIATLKHHTLQQGCGITGNAIAEKYNDQSLTKKFVDSSKENRGIVCSVEYPVEKPAIIKKDHVVFFKFPTGITP